MEFKKGHQSRINDSKNQTETHSKNNSVVSNKRKCSAIKNRVFNEYECIKNKLIGTYRVILKNPVWNKNDILYERVHIGTYYRHIILHKAAIVLCTN